MAVPAGPLSLPLDDVRDLIANSAAVQAWMGVGTVAAAKLRTFLKKATNPAGVTLTLAEIGLIAPCAIVNYADGGGPRIELASSTGFMSSGEIMVEFWQVLTETDIHDIAIVWENLIGSFIDDFVVLGKAGGFFWATTYDWQGWFLRHPAEAKTIGNLQAGRLQLEWDGGPAF